MIKSLVFGGRGQVGSYLCEVLLEDGHEVHVVLRRTSNPINQNIAHIESQLIIHQGDLTDEGSVHKIIDEVKPDYIFNLAAMSHVRWSYDIPATTMDINCTGLLRIIESVRQLKLDCKIYNAGSSEQFGKVQETPQTEKTPFYPRSPYGVSKVAAFYMARVYREAYNMKIYSGIVFNTDSPRRGEEFLTKKVCMAVAAIKNGKQDKLVLGNLEAFRDFSYAKETARWIYEIVKHDIPDDFLLATGETHSVKEFVIEAFKCAGIDNWQDYLEFEQALTRPAEVDLLLGDATKSMKILGFSPQVKFKELVMLMVEYELAKYREPKHSFGYIK